MSRGHVHLREPGPRRAGPGDTCRLALFAALAALCAVLRHPALILAACLLALAGLALTARGGGLRGRGTDLRASLLALNTFMALLWILSLAGVALAPNAAPDSWRRVISLCLAVTLKGNAALLFFWALLGPLGTSRQIAAWHRLGLPHEVCALLLIMARQTLYLRQLLGRLREALLLRHFRPRLDRRTAHALSALVALVFIRAGERSLVLRQTMSLRGAAGVWPIRHADPLSLPERALLALLLGAAVPLLAFDLGLLG